MVPPNFRRSGLRPRFAPSTHHSSGAALLASLIGLAVGADPAGRRLHRLPGLFTQSAASTSNPRDQSGLDPPIS
jgi:hypothetical protein